MLDVLIIILPLAAMIFLTRLINRHILKNKFIVDDSYRALRLVIIFFFVFSIFMTITRAIDWITTQDDVYRDQFIFAIQFMIIFGGFVLGFKYLYGDRYEEDIESFKFNGVFKKYDVSFDNIKCVKNVPSNKYGSALRIETFFGEKLRIRRGFYDIAFLEAYVNLNTDTNIYLEKDWVELDIKRKSLNPALARQVRTSILGRSLPLSVVEGSLRLQASDKVYLVTYDDQQSDVEVLMTAIS